MFLFKKIDNNIKQKQQAQQQKYYWISLGEHVVLSKLRIFVKLTTADSASLPRTMELLMGLAKFHQLTHTAVRGLLMNHFATAMRTVYQEKSLRGINDHAAWDMLIRLSEKCGVVAFSNGEKNPSIAAIYFDLLCSQVDQIVWPQNVPYLVQAIVRMYLLHAAGITPTAGSSPTEDSDWQRVTSSGEGLNVVETLTNIRDKLVARTDGLTRTSMECTSAWLSVLNGLAKSASCDSLTKDRSDALVALQRSILASETANLPIPVCYDAIDKVVMPLVKRLCGEQTEATDAAQQSKVAALQNVPFAAATADQNVGFLGRFSPTNAITSVFGGGNIPDSPIQQPMLKSGSSKAGHSGIEDLQTQVLALLCRSFLHFTEYSKISSSPNEFMAQWKELLAHLYAYYSRPPQGSEVVKEAVSEQTKNVVNVLASLPSCELSSIPEFWSTTRKQIAPFGEELSAALNAHLDQKGLPK